MTRRFLLLTMIISLAAALTPVSGGYSTAYAYGEGAVYDVPAGQYALVDEGTYNRFYNYVDGYSLPVDKALTADMRYSSVCATISNNNVRIQIFNQSLSGGVSRNSYQYYSNGFLKNSVDHFLEQQNYQVISGHNVYVTRWYRNKLSRLANDKNYYICFDIPSRAGEILTIFISSVQPIYLLGGFTHMIDGLQFFPKAAHGYIKKAAQTHPDSRDWSSETRAFYEEYFGAASSLKWGIFEPSFPNSPFSIKGLEADLNYTFPIALNYTGIDNKYMHPELESRLRLSHQEGKTLELTLQTLEAQAWESNQIYQILNGEYDEFLRQYANTVAAFRHPVLFRLGNEMNGDWCPYSGYNTSRDPSLYVEFYKYVYDFFKRAGANNVIWIWNPNGKSFPDFKWNNELMYYPGDDFVDVIGMTLYNNGTYYKDEHWIEFNVLYDSIYYPYLGKYDKPLMITEFACSQFGGDKHQWVINMFNHIPYYDRIKVAVWWNGADYDAEGNIARPYFLNSPMSLIPIFRNGLNKIPQTRVIDNVSWKDEVFA